MIVVSYYDRRSFVPKRQVSYRIDHQRNREYLCNNKQRKIDQQRPSVRISCYQTLIMTVFDLMMLLFIDDINHARVVNENNGFKNNGQDGLSECIQENGPGPSSISKLYFIVIIYSFPPFNKHLQCVK